MMHAITDPDWPLFQQLMRDYRSGALRSQPPQPASRSLRTVPPCVVCLLGNLDPGTVVEAERLVYRDDVEGIDIQVLGPSNGFFNWQVSVGGTLSEPISAHASAGEVESILRQHPGIADQLVDVTLGNSLERGYVPMRWRLALRPRDDGASWGGLAGTVRVNPNTMQVTPNRWHGTGVTVPVFAAIPVGEPTPLRCGAQGACLHFPGAGYGLIALEARKYTQMYFPTVSDL